VIESEIQCLKENLDHLVDIETADGEFLVAKVLSVFHDEANNEHEVFFEVVSSNMPHKDSESAVGCALDFGNILLVRPHSTASI